MRNNRDERQNRLDCEETEQDEHGENSNKN